MFLSELLPLLSLCKHVIDLTSSVTKVSLHYYFLILECSKCIQWKIRSQIKKIIVAPRMLIVNDRKSVGPNSVPSFYTKLNKNICLPKFTQIIQEITWFVADLNKFVNISFFLSVHVTLTGCQLIHVTFDIKSNF